MKLCKNVFLFLNWIIFFLYSFLFYFDFNDNEKIGRQIKQLGDEKRGRCNFLGGMV